MRQICYLILSLFPRQDHSYNNPNVWPSFLFFNKANFGFQIISFHCSSIIINNMKTESSPQRSTLQNLVNETQKMRGSLNDARQEKQEILRNLRKAEAENRAMDIRLKTIESERQRDLNENRRFMENLEQQKKEKIKLLTELSQAKNLLTRKDAEIAQLKSQSLSLQTENQRLYKQVQTSTQQQVTAIRDRQNTINQVKILETKHETAQMEKKFLTNRLAQVEGELHRVKEELGVVTKKYQQRQFGVQAIYKDEQVTKDRLLEQFQAKMSYKDEETRQEIQKYLNENSLLKQKIIELKGSLY